MGFPLKKILGFLFKKVVVPAVEVELEREKAEKDKSGRVNGPF